MKTVTIRELHARTGKVVREAARRGQILITDSGRTIARIVPELAVGETPYFARRKYISASMRRLIESGRLGRGGTDSTAAISEDREDRV